MKQTEDDRRMFDEHRGEMTAMQLVICALIVSSPNPDLVREVALKKLEKMIALGLPKALGDGYLQKLETTVRALTQ
ncbi:MAG: hypothetical protein Q8N13_11050 [Acidovorax sp.]|nr:hypothetical protein [Acidovorax sp.]